MKNLWILIIVLMAVACHRQAPSGFDSIKWEPVDSLADSTSVMLERMFYDAESPDSIAIVIDRLVADTTKGKVARISLARWHYWRGRLMKKLEDAEAANNHFQTAKALVDSNSYYYTYRRINTIINSSKTGLAHDYLHKLLDDLNYYSGIGDLVMDGSVSILIANALSNSYQPDFALEYSQRADSIHSLLGLEKYVVKNGINRASCLRRLGRDEECMRIIDNLLNDSAVTADFFTYNLVLRNAYVYSQEVTYLNRAYERMLRRDSTHQSNAVLEYLLSQHYLTSEKPDTALAIRYISKAFPRISNEPDPEIRSAMLLAKSWQMNYMGETDSALIYLQMHVQENDSLTTRKKPTEVGQIHNMEIMARYEYERNETHHFYVVRLLILIIVVVATAGVSAFVILRIKERHKRKEQQMQMAKMRSELDIERYRKQVLAISLAMEETDRNLEEIRGKFKELRESGKVSAEEMRNIDSVIKSHMANRDEIKRFVDMFEKTHPQFIINLKKHYPGLSDSQMKLAMYIYTGMTNKQIATYMNIRTESVKQARWRLRVKMGLNTDDSLEETLHNLSKTDE